MLRHRSTVKQHINLQISKNLNISIDIYNNSSSKSRTRGILGIPRTRSSDRVWNWEDFLTDTSRLVVKNTRDLVAWMCFTGKGAAYLFLSCTALRKPFQCLEIKNAKTKGFYLFVLLKQPTWKISSVGRLVLQYSTCLTCKRSPVHILSKIRNDSEKMMILIMSN